MPGAKPSKNVNLETVMPKTLRAKLARGIATQEWTEAKTYRLFAPHEYFMGFSNPELFKLFKTALAKFGVVEQFQLRDVVKKYTYLYVGHYRYWVDGGVLNRAEAKNIRHTAGVSSQDV